MSPPVQIRRVDPFDTVEHNLWWQAYAEAKRADMGENALIWTLEESRAEMQQRSEATERRTHVAVLDGAVVGGRSLQRHSPETPRIYTYNAASNAHMLAVNTRLGFRPTGRLGELQKKVG
ncbi:MAG: hypothetical protein VYC96_07770 [Actinomycetota bacterium]|nr:hypothetical protein [Actinomycetota bacterium]